MYEDNFYYQMDKKQDSKLQKEIDNINNRKYIADFDQQAKLDRKTIATTATNKQKLIILFKQYIKKDWKKLSKQDLTEIINQINNEVTYSEKTKSNYKKMLKQFDKFMNGGLECSDLTKWITSTPIKRKLNRLQRSDLLTDDEKKKLLRACDNPRDKAIVSIWLETGIRPKELRVLTVGSVTFEKELAFITIPQDTKTGSRPIPIYFSKPALLAYLQQHPAKDNDKAPLWYNMRHNEIKPINMKGFEYMLHKVAVRSGIKKRIYWYLGRHNSYTDKIAEGWNEGIIKQFHGIEAGSNVLTNYVHLSAKDVTSKIREYYGLEKGTKKGPELTLIKCVNCSADNASSNVRCEKCGYIIDAKEMQKELEKAQTKDQTILELKKQMAEILAWKNSREELDQAISRRKAQR